MSNPHERLLALLNSDGARLHALLFRMTLRPDVAEELMQKLFLKLSQSIAFATAEHPFAYARRVAINLAMERRRSQHSDPTIGAIDVDEMLTEQMSSPLEDLVRAEQLEQILDGLSELSEQSRECFVLRFIEMESYEMIAGRIGKTAHQARGLCHAAVKQLRERLAVKSNR
ncbi:MAG TPA: sigma-70 family RNA polymerase sigma factor [Tepidisphaeraceae bacterium]|nr:sigma-70 family RNA polymerase sigma factor [Tepidisphaeraceae bacterium]